MPPSWLRPARTWPAGRGGRDARRCERACERTLGAASRRSVDRARGMEACGACGAGRGGSTQRGRTMSRYAPELVEGGFAVEVADAPLLHDGLNVADVAHVLVLRERGVIPDSAARALLGVLRDAVATPWSEFGYDPAHGEVYNCRERRFAA